MPRCCAAESQRGWAVYSPRPKRGRAHPLPPGACAPTCSVGAGDSGDQEEPSSLKVCLMPLLRPMPHRLCQLGGG